MKVKTSINEELDLEQFPRVDKMEYPNLHQGIYLIYNLINDKVYVGRSVNVRLRWLNHCEKNTDKTAIDTAINKYGKENFVCYLLEEVENFSDLPEREYEWGNLIDICYAPIGYNIAPCGDKKYIDVFGEDAIQYPIGIQVSAYDNNGNLVKTYPTLTEAIRKEGTNGIMKASMPEYDYKKVKGYYWRRGIEPSIEVNNLYKPLTGPNGGYDIYAYDLISGDLVEGFSNAAEASNWLIQNGSEKTCNTANISSAARDEINYSFGYYWAYSKVNNIFDIRPHRKIIAEQKKLSFVNQYSMDGKLLNTYSSSVMAAKATGLRAANVGNCCTGLTKSCGGFKWKYTYKK